MMMETMNQNEGNITARLCYSREFLLKYDKYTLDQEIANLINHLNNIWLRQTPKKKMITITVDSPSPDSKTPGRFCKSFPKKKLNGSNVFEKNGKAVTPKSMKLNPPPGLNVNGNDTVFRANSYPTFDSGTVAVNYGNETPRKTASYPLISYTDIFSQTGPIPLNPGNIGDSKFVSLFSQPVSSELCGDLNLKPYLSLDFIEDPPQQQPKPQSRTPVPKPEVTLKPVSPRNPETNLKPVSPRNPEATLKPVTPRNPVDNSLKPVSPSILVTGEKTPLKNSKTPGKSPRNRGASPLDEQRLVQRQKQIDYGYRTMGYLRYRLLVPKEARKPDHPRTPKKVQACSKRSWDGQLKKWRRDFHLWDPDNLEAFRNLLNSEVVETLVTTHPELKDIVKSVKDKLDNPHLKNNEEDEDDELASFPSFENSGEKNQFIAEPNNNNKHKVARALIF